MGQFMKKAYAPNNRAPKHIKQKQKTKGGINTLTIVVPFSLPLSIINATTKKVIHKETEDWGNTENQQTQRHFPHPTQRRSHCWTSQVPYT